MKAKEFIKTAVGMKGVQDAGEVLQSACHGIAKESGWWTDLCSGESTTSYAGEPPKVNVPEKLMLIVSEVSEGMEGHRKGLADDKLPHRSMLEAELADVVIRAFDLAGGLGLNLGGTIGEKLAFNATRADHKIENRKLDGGKKY